MFESENSFEYSSSSNSIEDAVKYIFPFTSLSDSGCSNKEDELKNEDENIFFKSALLLLKPSKILPKKKIHIKPAMSFSLKSTSFQQSRTSSKDSKVSICVELKEESQINSKNSTKLQKKRNKSPDLKEKKKDKLNNWRKMIARDFFNKFLINKFEKIATDCKCMVCFEKFPENFIFNVIKINNTEILEITFEDLIKNEDLYEGKENIPYSKNKKAIEKLQSDKYKAKMEELGYDKTLKMKFKDLYKEYLRSDEYKDKKDKLYKKKGFSEVEKFEELSKKFIEYYKN